MRLVIVVLQYNRRFTCKTETSLFNMGLLYCFEFNVIKISNIATWLRYDACIGSQT